MLRLEAGEDGEHLDFARCVRWGRVGAGLGTNIGCYP